AVCALASVGVLFAPPGEGGARLHPRWSGGVLAVGPAPNPAHRKRIRRPAPGRAVAPRKRHSGWNRQRRGHGDAQRDLLHHFPPGSVAKNGEQPFSTSTRSVLSGRYRRPWGGSAR